MLDVLIVLALVLLNGAFALGELSVVSSRRPKLQALAEGGSRGAAIALQLAANPGRFLSTIQIGITLVAILTGAFSGDALGIKLEHLLVAYGAPEVAAHIVGFGGSVAIVTYLSLVLGELVPKQLALRHPERIAVVCAVPLLAMTTVVSPLASVLDVSTRLVFALLGQSHRHENLVSEEEVRAVITEAEQAGVLEADERRIIAGVMRLSDRSARAIMTPRTDVDMLDLTVGPDAQRAVLTETSHSRLPVHIGNPDEPIGVVQTRKALTALMNGSALDSESVLPSAPIVQDMTDALTVLSVLQQAEVPMALVHDEYGHFEGVVTPADVLSAIAGAFRADMEPSDPDAVQREDGSWLFSGSMAVDDMADRLALKLSEDRSYHTVAGFVLFALGRLPQTGESVTTEGYRFEVVDMDGRRIDKVLVAKARAA